ncbi:hypothetical protein [Pseudoduganella violaceinigra]|uniref:hypothetical protein n=1 Tax=Pseudoduganella violaceinigra TaxID=246602 RepID=UPI0004009C8D|nr:hypothetical protein [Pseudoduganella violaceinigra]
MGIENEFLEFKALVEATLPTLATKADVEAMRADIARWMLATVIGLFIGYSGLIVALTRTPAAAPVAQAAPCQPCMAPQPAQQQEKSPR